MLPGGRRPACGRAGAAECGPWGTLAGGDRPSKHKWPWEASPGGHRLPGHVQVGGGGGGVVVVVVVESRASRAQPLIHPKGK